MNDNDIIELYFQRNETAITVSDNKYGNYCRSISYNILQSHEDSEECVNETWLRAWNSIPPNRPSRLSSFFGRITRNLSLNRYKSINTQKRGKGHTELILSELDDCIPDISSVESAFDERVLTDSLNSFLYAQPKQKRNVFIRRYWYLSPISDIAKTCNMSESKVTSMLFRMRKELKAYLEKEGITI